MQLLNLPREIAHYLIGKEHKTSHRMVAGLFVMFAGVSTAHAGALIPVAIVAHSVDLVGYFIHALGAVPYLEWLLEEMNDRK